jgi:hypothetical protein
MIQFFFNFLYILCIFDIKKDDPWLLQNKPNQANLAAVPRHDTSIRKNKYNLIYLFDGV